MFTRTKERTYNHSRLLTENIVCLSLLNVKQNQHILKRYVSSKPRAGRATLLCVPDLARDVVFINDWLLEEHVETSLVLSERVASDPTEQRTTKCQEQIA